MSPGGGASRFARSASLKGCGPYPAPPNNASISPFARQHACDGERARDFALHPPGIGGAMPEHVVDALGDGGAILRARIAARAKPFADETIRRQRRRIQSFQNFDCCLDTSSGCHGAGLAERIFSAKVAKNARRTPRYCARAARSSSTSGKNEMARRSALQCLCVLCETLATFALIIFSSSSTARRDSWATRASRPRHAHGFRARPRP